MQGEFSCDTQVSVWERVEVTFDLLGFRSVHFTCFRPALTPFRDNDDFGALQEKYVIAELHTAYHRAREPTHRGRAYATSLRYNYAKKYISAF